MIHEIKISTEHADTIIADGRKGKVHCYDRVYNAGDKVKFIVYDGTSPNQSHPLNGCVYKITSLTEGLHAGCCFVFGVEADTSMTNQEKFCEVFGLDAWKQMIAFTSVAEQFKEFLTSPYSYEIESENNMK